MKKHYILYFLLFFSFSDVCRAQIRFEKGYFIDSSDRKVECLIRNVDRKNNPTEFEYKLTEGEAALTIGGMLVKEFGIYNFSKFIRTKVKIDRSSDDLDKMSFERNPVWSEETLFLKVLTEGEASLYSYEEGPLTRFFYKVKDAPIKQLIYKQYLLSPGIVNSNVNFRQQLLVEVNCNQTATTKSVGAVEYRRNSLMNYFEKYNTCTGGDIPGGFREKKEKTIFRLKATLGAGYASLSIMNSMTEFRRDFDPKISFRAGLEGEFILPFNKNKWGIFLEPNYQYFHAEKAPNPEDNVLKEIATVRYNSIELPVGFRHYFFLSRQSKIFINAAFVFDFSFNSSVDFEKSESLKVLPKNNVAVGLGFNFGRLGAEFRYYTNRNILDNYVSIGSVYRKVSFILSCRIF